MAISSSGSEISGLSTPTVRKKFKSSFLAATYASSNDTPSFSYLKYGIRTLSDEIQKKNKKIRGLQQIVRRKNKKIFSLYEIICKLKNNIVLTEEDSDIQSFGNENMEELVDIDNINDDDFANVCNDNMLNNYLNGNEKMEELVDIDNINDDDFANLCNDNMLNNYLNGNEKMEELVDIDNINDDDFANVCSDNMLNNYLNGDFMDTSYIKQNVNNIQHDHNYFIADKGLMNEKYADVNRTIINDASTDQLDKDVSLPTFDQPEKTSITITNAPKSVLKNSTNILPKYKDYTIQWLLDSNTI